MRELFRECVVAKRRAAHERDLDMFRAWHVAGLTARASVGKLPSLKELLRQMRSGETQTVQEQRNVLGEIAGAFGLRLRKAKRKSMKQQKKADAR